MKVRFIASVVFLGILGGCTDPGEKTAISAATGGVLGAGLGAIVGNQTGDPGTGLVVGALAGGAAGAAVGNAIEAQEVSMRTQDEAIERQQKVIQAQSAEISELRRAGGDAPAVRGRSGSPVTTREATRYSRPSTDAGASARANPRYGSLSSAASPPAAKQIASRDITPERVPESRDRARLGWADTLEDPVVEERLERAEAEVSGETRGTAQKLAETQNGGDCAHAETEHSKALATEDASEQLFHLRRALRLCPDQATVHASLGESYLKLNRKEDAVFEFKEALRLDPALTSAQENLRLLENIPGGRY